jgi:FlaA1/EpsC-like NDP-sugar epimerase
MNNKTLDHLLIAITVLLDLCFVATAIVVAYWIRFESGWTPEALALHKGGPPPLDDYFRLIPLMVIIWLMTLKGLKLYRPESNATLSAFWTLCKAAGISLIATLATLFFIYHHDAYSRWVMLLATGFSLVGLFLGRLVLHRFRQSIHAQGVGVQRLAIVGNYDTRVEQFINVLNAKADSGYEVVGIIDETAVSSQPSAVRKSILGQLRIPHKPDNLFTDR